MAATLRVSRKSGLMNSVPSAGRIIVEGNKDFAIVLDGQAVGSIAPGSTVDVPVDPGSHTLRIKSPRHESPERRFKIGDGEVVTFSTRHATFWPELVAAMIKPDRWISLKEKTERAL
ncbi:MAG TPA: hypothetical protein VGL20_04475 [Candidatus Dormibacteraeota bacterium]